MRILSESREVCPFRRPYIPTLSPPPYPGKKEWSFLRETLCSNKLYHVPRNCIGAHNKFSCSIPQLTVSKNQFLNCTHFPLFKLNNLPASRPLNQETKQMKYQDPSHCRSGFAAFLFLRDLVKFCMVEGWGVG